MQPQLFMRQVHTAAITPGDIWRSRRCGWPAVAIMGFDAAHGRVRVLRDGARRDTFIRARTLGRHYEIAVHSPQKVAELKRVTDYLQSAATPKQKASMFRRALNFLRGKGA